MSQLTTACLLAIALLAGLGGCSKDEKTTEPDYVQPGASEGDEVPPTTTPMETPPSEQPTDPALSPTQDPAQPSSPTPPPSDDPTMSK